MGILCAPQRLGRSRIQGLDGILRSKISDAGRGLGSEASDVHVAIVQKLQGCTIGGVGYVFCDRGNWTLMRFRRPVLLTELAFLG